MPGRNTPSAWSIDRVLCEVPLEELSAEQLLHFLPRTLEPFALGAFDCGRVEAWMGTDTPLRLLETARAAATETAVSDELDPAIGRIRVYLAAHEPR